MYFEFSSATCTSAIINWLESPVKIMPGILRFYPSWILRNAHFACKSPKSQIKPVQLSWNCNQGEKKALTELSSFPRASVFVTIGITTLKLNTPAPLLKLSLFLVLLDKFISCDFETQTLFYIDG